VHDELDAYARLSKSDSDSFLEFSSDVFVMEIVMKKKRYTFWALRAVLLPSTCAGVTGLIAIGAIRDDMSSFVSAGGSPILFLFSSSFLPAASSLYFIRWRFVRWASGLR
jgi:hypothetical protein